MPSTLLIASSQAAGGASNVSSDGASFDLDLASPLTFPPGSNPRIAIAEAGVWYSFPNISAALGNNIVYYTDNGALPLKWAITFEDGLYSLDSINQKMSVAFQANGHPTDIFEFVGDEATGRVYLVKTVTTTAFQFNFAANSPAADLGFAANSSFPNTPGTAAFNQLSPNQAALDRVTAVMIHCSLAAGASWVGPSSGAALASFTPGDAGVGQLINYKPYFQQWVDIPRMAGSSIQRLNFWVTDQTGRRGSISTNNEPWSVSIVLEW